MNKAQLETVWAPRLLSILRIVAALIFMAHGTQKLLGFPISPNPAPAAFSESRSRCIGMPERHQPLHTASDLDDREGLGMSSAATITGHDLLEG